VTIRIEGNRTVETVLRIVFFPTRESKQESVRPRVKANSGTLSVLEDFVEVCSQFIPRPLAKSKASKEEVEKKEGDASKVSSSQLRLQLTLAK
jgi:hypothetical protein